MKTIKLVIFAVLTVSFCTCFSTITLGEVGDITNPAVKTPFDAEKTKDTKTPAVNMTAKAAIPGLAAIDPHMLVPGNAGIDPHMLISGNPEIDPHFLVNTKLQQIGRASCRERV